MAKRAGTPTVPDQVLRDQLLGLLEGGHAHATFDQAIRGLPATLRGRVPKGLPYSPWQLLEHLRIAQWDILEFSRDPAHVSPKWPEGYWAETKPTDASWRRSVAAFRRDLKAMQSLIANTRADLFTPFPWGDGQTLLREALVLADHNAYHIGQLVSVRRLLGAWGS